MQATTAAKGPRGELEIPGRMHPVLAALVIIPGVVILFIVAALLIENVPLPLMALFGATAFCCAALCMAALKSLLGGKLTIAADKLVVHQFLSQVSYPWAALEDVKVVPATGTFGDNPLVDVTERVGLGLFLKDSKRAREHDLDADVIVCAGEASGVARLMSMVNKIRSGLKHSMKPVPRKRQPIRQANQRKEFRQQNQPVDVVSSFRNK